MLSHLIPLLQSALLFVGTSSASDSSTVSLDYGVFQGATDGNLSKFLGVPFARPVGRFQLPEPPLPLSGLQDAAKFGPACPQQALTPIPIFFNNNYTSISESRLTLDVFTPTSAHPRSKLPVLVWIYGGGFEVGNSNNTDVRPTVERSILLGEPILIVALNYRVSAFGFLGGKEVQDAGVTNLGLRDQILALEWVQKHIAAFGGDPDRVVIGGQSAGAISTGLLLLSNKRTSPGLFRGAFMASGSPLPSPTVADGQSSYDGLVAANNCTAAHDTLDCLRRVPFDAFMASVNRTADLFSYHSLSLVWRPRVDGDVIVRNPPVSVAEGAFAKIPILSGDCDDEGTCSLSRAPTSPRIPSLSTTFNLSTRPSFRPRNKPDKNIRTYLRAGTASQVARIAELYPQDPAQGSPFGTGSANQLTPEFKRIAAFQGDFTFIGVRRLFLQHASKTQNTWSWLNKRGKSTPDLGAFHSSDMPLFFPTNSTAATDTVAIDALINFINTLDPNVSAAPNSTNNTVFWPKWQTSSVDGSTSLLTFSDPLVVNVTADDFRADGIGFLNNLHLSGVTAVGM